MNQLLTVEHPRKREYSAQFKASVLEQCRQLGASLAGVAQCSPDGVESLPQLVNLRFVQWLGRRRAGQHQLGSFFQLFERGHGCGRAVMPDVRSEPIYHDRTNWRAALSITTDRLTHEGRRRRVTGPVVSDQRHVADLHHKIRRDRRQQLGFSLVRMLQSERHAMRAVGVNNAARGRVQRCCCGINTAVQGDGFAGLVTADLLTARIQFGKASRIEKTQTRVRWCDEKSVLKPHADVAGGGVHVAALKQAFANPTDVFAGAVLSVAHRARSVDSAVKALLKKSSEPKLPDLSVKCKPLPLPLTSSACSLTA